MNILKKFLDINEEPFVCTKFRNHFIKALRFPCPQMQYINKLVSLQRKKMYLNWKLRRFLSQRRKHHDVSHYLLQEIQIHIVQVTLLQTTT